MKIHHKNKIIHDKQHKTYISEHDLKSSVNHASELNVNIQFGLSTYLLKPEPNSLRIDPN